jgi:hypothetical protein
MREARKEGLLSGVPTLPQQLYVTSQHACVAWRQHQYAPPHLSLFVLFFVVLSCSLLLLLSCTRSTHINTTLSHTHTLYHTNTHTQTPTSAVVVPGHPSMLSWSAVAGVDHPRGLVGGATRKGRGGGGMVVCGCVCVFVCVCV